MVARSALCSFKAEVENKIFPGAAFSPYTMQQDELQHFAEMLKRQGFEQIT
jgi:phosphosulfolactate synthase (CoM biosynthesis protein A)